MCPITNFAKGRFSEIQSRVSNSLTVSIKHYIPVFMRFLAHSYLQD